MPVPPKPGPPALFGASAAEREASRHADALRFTWADVADALTYDILFGASDVRAGVAKGQFLGGLSANTRHQVRLRGVNADGPSEWSDPATFATRPDRPGPPSLPSPGDRGADRIRITWNPVNAITTYVLKLNGAEYSGTFQPPALLTQLPGGGPLRPNERYIVAVRARDDAVGGLSEWSADAVFVTRPPRPAAPLRVPYDLSLWGIVLRWAVSDSYNGGPMSFVRLFRAVDGNRITLLDGGARSRQFLDDEPLMNVEKTYTIQAIVPAAATPAPVPEDGGENRSFESDPLRAKYPLYMQALRPIGDSLRRGLRRTTQDLR